MNEFFRFILQSESDSDLFHRNDENDNAYDTINHSMDMRTDFCAAMRRDPIESTVGSATGY